MSKTTGYEEGAPRGRSRERLIEQVAVEALKLAEAGESTVESLRDEVLTERDLRRMGDEQIIEGALRAVLLALPDDCVWFLSEATQAVIDSGVYRAAYYDAYDARIVRMQDVVADCVRDGGRIVAPQVLAETPYVQWTEKTFHADGFGFRSRAEFEESRERAAKEIARAELDRFTFALVRDVCEATLRRSGLNFFEDRYVALWAKWTERAGIVWSSYEYPKGVGPAYE